MIINLTPHAITIMLEQPMVIEPTFPPARVSVANTPAEPVDGIPTVRTVIGTVENLPEPAEGVVYVVSALVAQQCQDRNDVFAPDTSPTGAVRDDKGLIIGVKGLLRY